MANDQSAYGEVSQSACRNSEQASTHGKIAGPREVCHPCIAGFAFLSSATVSCSASWDQCCQCMFSITLIAKSW